MPQTIGEGAFTYEIQLQWAKLPDSWILKDVADVAVDDANDRVYVFQRWKHPMLVFDREGNFIETWGSEIFTRAHGVTLGPDGHLYCVDDYGHNVRKCTVAGEVLQTWGTPDRSSGHFSGKPFNGPTKVAFDPKTNGFYVSDGYGNARVHKYSAEGDYLFSWGEPGQGPGQFNLVHSVNTDREGRVYVASREGTRLQVFDDEGNYLTEWRGPHKPNGVTISKNEPQLCYIGEAFAAFPANKGSAGFWRLYRYFRSRWPLPDPPRPRFPPFQRRPWHRRRRDREYLLHHGFVGSRTLDRPRGTAAHVQAEKGGVNGPENPSWGAFLQGFPVLAGCNCKVQSLPPDVSDPPRPAATPPRRLYPPRPSATPPWRGLL